MTAPRFYCPTPLAAHQTIDLPDELAHHAVRVLRLRAGSDITLFDGAGGEYPATLDLQGRQAIARLGAHHAREAELAVRITLAQGLPASGKMDWIVEKAVELGVHALVPLLSRRSPPQPEGARLEKRLQHWQRIAQAAAEQCGRNRLMQIAPPLPSATFLQQAADDRQPVLLCHPEGNDTLSSALQPPPTALTLMVGPEGGWDDAELLAADRAGVRRIRFGARVLRTETAGLALVAAASALLDA